MELNLHLIKFYLKISFVERKYKKWISLQVVSVIFVANFKMKNLMFWYVNYLMLKDILCTWSGNKI